MENRGYYIIDGSHLFSSIFELWRIKPQFSGRKLEIGLFSEALIRKWSVYVGATIRVIYYFKQNDSRMRTLINIPDSFNPGTKNHWQIKECGESIEAVPQEELLKISERYRDHFTRSEKGLDIKLTCDVLMLIASNRASNFVFLVNDRDYLPLFESVEMLGGNVYLTALDNAQSIQKGLAKLADRYLTFDDELDALFGVTPSQPPQEPLQQV